MKRRRSGRNNRKELFVDNPEMGLDLTQKKLKGLHLQYKESQYRNLSYQVGDQVEAIKWTDTVREWYCARVIEISYDSNTTAGDALVFVHYEGWPPDEADWISPTLIRIHNPRASFHYGPKGPESDRSWKDFAEFYKSKLGEQARYHTGLVHDRRMSLHCCPCQSRETIHPERPDRISSILQALHANRLLRYFGRIHPREISTQELLRVHTYSHVRNYYPIDEDKRPMKITSIAALLNPEPPLFKPTVMRGVGGGLVKEANQDHIKRQHTKFSSAAAAVDATQTDPKPVAPPGLICEMTCGELGIAVDTTFHPLHSSLSARIAAGALLSLVEPIIHDQLRNGFALIRPPGHHAESDTAMGFCFYNNVAVAVADTLEKYPTKIKKILIIDWDIHHGNGTQKMFYDNPNVLYISIHRWDKGRFYPFTGAPDECGEGNGLGTNINITFSSSEDKP
ncbi:Histone deacetylase, partial [Rhizopus stolonifer]